MFIQPTFGRHSAGHISIHRLTWRPSLALGSIPASSRSKDDEGRGQRKAQGLAFRAASGTAQAVLANIEPTNTRGAPVWRNPVDGPCSE